MIKWIIMGVVALVLFNIGYAIGYGRGYIEGYDSAKEEWAFRNIEAMMRHYVSKANRGRQNDN